MEHPVSIEALSPQAAKVCGPNAPPQMKAMAAGGLAPLGPVDLLSALYVLCYDSDQSIVEKAGATLGGLPENVLDGALKQIDNPVVLDGLARLFVRKSAAAQTIILNHAVADETALWMAKKAGDQGLMEILAGNDERLIRMPSLIEALYNNKATRMSTADRMVEFAVRNGLELTGIACFNEVKAAIDGELIPEASDEPTPDDLFFRQNLDKLALEDLDEKKVEEALDAEEGAETTEESDKVESLQQSLARMTTSAKIRVATLGSGTQRAILIRDANKLVCMAVIKSPGIRESEIMQYSKFRSLPEEAIRYMATNREWTKHYGVKLNLVQNPRCPLEIALRFMNFLRVNDVRALERDKNIPQAVANAARQLRAKRMK